MRVGYCTDEDLLNFPNLEDLNVQAFPRTERVHEQVKILTIHSSDSPCNFALFPGLMQLNLGDTFSDRLNGLQLCTGLKQIKFGKSFNDQIYALSWCRQLEVVEFGENFNKNIFPLNLSNRLRIVSFGRNFNEYLTYIESCEKIERIALSTDYTKSYEVFFQRGVEIKLLP